MSTEPFARSISVDYSDDELDAISEAFTRRDIARRVQADDVHDPVRRARNQTALRGLVARHAITLGGTPARPRLTFLEPHATLLGAFVAARSIATVRHEEGPIVRAVSFFVHDEVVVEQTALPGMSIQRMTAHGRSVAGDLLAAELALPVLDSVEGPSKVEVTKRMITHTIAAVANGEPAPSCVPDKAADIFFARRGSGSVTITSRDESGILSAEKWSWIDAGELGLWRVQTNEDSPLVTLSSADGEELTGEIASAWDGAR